MDACHCQGGEDPSGGSTGCTQVLSLPLVHGWLQSGKDFSTGITYINPDLPDISDGQDEELLGKERQVKKQEARLKRNTKVSKTLQRYSPKLGDLVYLQDRKSLKWDIPTTIQMVRPGGRSVHCLTEDDVLYLHSHLFIRKRTDCDDNTDALPTPDKALTEQTVSTTETDSVTEAMDSKSARRRRRRRRS